MGYTIEWYLKAIKKGPELMWMIYRQISELKKMRLSANGQGVYGFDTEASALDKFQLIG